MNENTENNFTNGSTPKSRSGGHAHRGGHDAAARRHRLDRLLLERDIDAVLDRDADEHTVRRVNAALELDAAIRHDFNATREVIDRLANPPRSPDFSSQILRSMERTRPFVESRGHRRVLTLRWVSAAMAASVLLAGAIGMRLWSNSIVNKSAELSMAMKLSPADASADASRFFAGTSFADAASQNAASSRYLPAGTLVSLSPRVITGPSIAARSATTSSDAGRLLVSSGPLSLGDTSRHEAPLWRTAGDTRLAREHAGSGALIAAGDGTNPDTAPLGSRVAIRDRDGTVWTVSPSLLARTPANASQTQAIGMMPAHTTPARFSPLWVLPGLEGSTVPEFGETGRPAPLKPAPQNRGTHKPTSR